MSNLSEIFHKLKKNSERYSHCLHRSSKLKFPLSYQISIKPEFSGQTLEKYIFHENPFIESRVDQCGRDGRTDRQRERQTDRQTDMTKPTVAFRNFSKAPIKGKK